MLAGLERALDFPHASLPPSDLDLSRPLKHLLFALRDLEDTGHKARCFKTKRRGPADSIVIADLKARALAISDLILAHKASPREQADIEAARKVSPRARALGVATRVIAKDLKSWRRNTRSRLRRHQRGAQERPTTFLIPSRRRARAVSLNQRITAIHRQIERFAPMFDTRERLDLDGLIRAILPEGDTPRG
jgi:hypothetical protein